jgi:hypothetical protein
MLTVRAASRLIRYRKLHFFLISTSKNHNEDMILCSTVHLLLPHAVSMGEKAWVS